MSKAITIERAYPTFNNITYKPEITVGDIGYTTLAASVTIIGSTPTALVLPPGTHVGGGVTIPSTINLKISKGATITVANGATFTINGTLDAGPYQIFSCTGTGAVSFGPRSITQAHVEWFGTGLAAFLAAMTSLASVGHCKLSCAYGTYTWTDNTGIRFADGVDFDAQGSIFNTTMNDGTSKTNAFDMGNDTSLRNATINVSSTYNGGSGTDRCCPIGIGTYGTGVGVQNVLVENIIINGNNSYLNSNGIFITGNSNAIIIRNIDMDGGSKIGRGILAHWGGADAPTTRTTHPNNLLFENIKMKDNYPSLTARDDAVVALSGTYNVKVKNLIAYNCNQILLVYAGDYGDTYADADQKGLAGYGISFENILALDVNYRILKVDGLPNSVGNPQAMPVYLKNVTGIGKAGNAGSGLVPGRCSGAIFENCVAKNFLYSGFASDEALINCTIIGGEFSDNGYAGISLGSSFGPPQHIKITGAKCVRNNTSGSTYPGILISGPGIDDITVRDCWVGGDILMQGRHISTGYDNSAFMVDSRGRNLALMGVAVGQLIRNSNDGSIGRISAIGDAEAVNDKVSVLLAGGAQNDWDNSDGWIIYTNNETQLYGIKVSNEPTNITLENNFCGGTKDINTSCGFLVATSTIWNRKFYLINNRCDPSVRLSWSGLKSLVPDQTAVVVPATGNWELGQRIWKVTPAAAASPGWVVTASGTAGGSYTDTTGDTDGSTNAITGMTSTTGLVPGDYVTVSAGFAGTGPYRVIEVTSATAIKIEVDSNSAQSNITVAHATPVFTAMPALP